MNKHQDFIHLLYCISRQYLGFLTCSLKSISLNGGDCHYDIYILLSYVDEAMEKTLSRCYGPNMTFHVIQPTADVWDQIPYDIQSLGEKIFRFLAPYLLPKELDRILYLDADTVILNSLAELYETPFEDNLVAACIHGRERLKKINETRKLAEKPILGIHPGVMLMNLSAFRKEIPLSKTLGCLRKKKPHGVSLERFALAQICGPQMKLVDSMRFHLCEKVLNIYNAEHRNSPIDENWIRNNTSVIHFCGYPKPGGPEYIGALNPFYKELFRTSKVVSM